MDNGHVVVRAAGMRAARLQSAGRGPGTISSTD